MLKNGKSPYFGKEAVLTTIHSKARALALPLSAGLGLTIVETSKINTDLLGTFSGEIERQGSPKETVLKKARLGLEENPCGLALATEGTFGEDLFSFFIPGHHELLLFIDDHLGIEIYEQILTADTNFAHITADAKNSLESFLKIAKFPSHALIVKANQGASVGGFMKKGIRELSLLQESIRVAARSSKDGLAMVETDMRAHMNPTRSRNLRKLGIKLAHRLQSHCPSCHCPGFGLIEMAGSLPCEDCGFNTNLAAYEIFKCALCDYFEQRGRRDGLEKGAASSCMRCNP